MQTRPSFEFCIDYQGGGIADQLWSLASIATVLEQFGGSYRHLGFHHVRSGAAAFETLELEAAFASIRIAGTDRDQVVALSLTEGDDAAASTRLSRAIADATAGRSGSILAFDSYVAARVCTAILRSAEPPPSLRLPPIANLAERWIAMEPDLAIPADKVNIVVHIRLGDVWELSIPPRESLTPEPHRHGVPLTRRTSLDLREIYAVLAILRERFGPAALNLLIFTDGFHRSRAALARPPSHLDAFELSLAKRFGDFDEGSVWMMRRAGLGRWFVGEDPAHLRKLFAAMLRADIVLGFGLQHLAEKIVATCSGGAGGPRVFRVTRYAQEAPPLALPGIAQISLAAHNLDAVFRAIDQAQRRKAAMQPGSVSASGGTRS